LFINNIFGVIALNSVSMGQGQELHARRMISEAMSTGGWVLLQNIHLSLPFCTEVMDALVETETVHEVFRLWMTTEVHPQFPIGLLQVKVLVHNVYLIYLILNYNINMSIVIYMERRILRNKFKEI